jgi:hypothetical protein
MRTTALALAAILGLPALARAQVDIQISLPAVLPPMVVVQPGVQVVPEQREEVFFHDGWYWVRRDGYWYRSRDHRRGWVVVPGPRVPARLASIPPGRYRNWKVEHEMEKAERRHEKAEWKAEKRREKEERREEREERHEHGHGEGHGEGHGHGHGHDHDD